LAMLPVTSSPLLPKGDMGMDTEQPPSASAVKQPASKSRARNARAITSLPAQRWTGGRTSSPAVMQKTTGEFCGERVNAK
jgi:hypothetical protein